VLSHVSVDGTLPVAQRVATFQRTLCEMCDRQRACQAVTAVAPAALVEPRGVVRLRTALWDAVRSDVRTA
jgi:hypothetical protein